MKRKKTTASISGVVLKSPPLALTSSPLSRANLFVYYEEEEILIIFILRANLFVHNMKKRKNVFKFVLTFSPLKNKPIYILLRC